MDLIDYRENLDEIDKELTKLFEKRMNIISDIIIYKKENNIQILDEKREKEVIIKNIEYLEDKNLSNYLESFFINIMDVSKKYQKDKKR